MLTKNNTFVFSNTEGYNKKWPMPHFIRRQYRYKDIGNSHSRYRDKCRPKMSECGRTNKNTEKAAIRKLTPLTDRNG